MRRLVSIGLFAAFAWIAPGSAEDLVFRADPKPKAQSAPAAAAPTNKTTVSSEPSTPSSPPDCAVASIRVSPTKSNGKTWDWMSTPEPDIEVLETGTGANVYCENSLVCQLTVRTPAEVLSFRIEDRDNAFGANDALGNGSCALGDTCAFGHVTVAVNAC